MERKSMSPDEQRLLHVAAGKAIYNCYRERHTEWKSVPWEKLPSDERMFWRRTASRAIDAIAELEEPAAPE
jgi:hypothetical protein